ITGQLQHPGIPAVHQVGTLSDGRPFLAMKLVKGQTLDEQLRGRPDRAAERGRFLAVFEAICNAVGYAHAHQVIHRDLKPHNIMVGAFGEVQVMDWGLARAVRNVEHGTGNAADEPITELLTPQSALDTPQLTKTGTVLGTPAYMSPEQASGSSALVNERSDVFGLGAMLCSLLTGLPPYTGKDAFSVQLRAVCGDTAEAFARLAA